MIGLVFSLFFAVFLVIAALSVLGFILEFIADSEHSWYVGYFIVACSGVVLFSLIFR